MAFPNHLLPLSTWSNIGLGIAGIFISLGSYSLLSPTAAAEMLGITDLTTDEARTVLHKGMAFIGIRDVAAALALFVFYREGHHRAMGVLLTALTLVCGVDTGLAAQGPNGVDGAIWAQIVAASVVALTGLGLLQA